MSSKPATADPMPNLTSLNTAQVQAALDGYGLGLVQEFTLAGDGIENSNYLIRTESGSQVVLTILEQPSYTQHNAYVALLDLCHTAGLPVPRVLRTTTGASDYVIADKPAIISQFLRGAHIGNANPDQISAIGRFLARFHLATQQHSDQAGHYPRTASWLTECADQLQGHLNYQEQSLLVGVSETCHSLFARADLKDLPWGFIHGDLFRDNALFNEQGLSGVLDFHHCAGGYWLYDLAVTANDWCTTAAGDLDPNKTMHLLQSYHDIRPISQMETWWFASFCQYAAAVFFTSRLLTQRLQPQARCKDPAVFMRILQSHLRRPLYLDARLFR